MGVLTRSFSKREKALLIILALIILGACYYFFVQKPVQSQMELYNTEIEDLTTENDILAIRAAKKEQMLSEVDNILADPNAQEIPAFDNLSMLTAFLNQVLRPTTGYDISCGDVQLDEKAMIYRRPVSISCTVRNYKQAKTILETLAACPYCSQVGSVSLEPFNSKGVEPEKRVDNIEDGGVTIKMSMTFYEKQ